MSKAKSYTATGEPEDIESLESDSLVINGINVSTQLQTLLNEINSLKSRVSALEWHLKYYNLYYYLIFGPWQQHQVPAMIGR